MTQEPTGGLVVTPGENLTFLRENNAVVAPAAELLCTAVVEDLHPCGAGARGWGSRTVPEAAPAALPPREGASPAGHEHTVFTRHPG